MAFILLEYNLPDGETIMMNILLSQCTGFYIV